MKKIVMVLSLMLMMVAISAPSQAKIYKGTYQKNTKWRYNTKTKKLVIAAKGKIKEEVLDLCEPNGGREILFPWKKWHLEVKDIILKKGVTELAKEIFADFVELRNVRLPNGLRKISEGSFRFADKLKKVNLPYTVKIVEDSSFSVSGLEKINLKRVKKIGEYAFNDTKISDVVIRKNIKYSTGIYNECKNVKKVTIQKGVKKISNYMFYVPNMESIVIPKSVTSIGEKAFYQFSTDPCKLKKVTIKSKNIKHWGKDIFGEPSEEMQIIVPKEKLKEYKKALRKKGLSARVKVIGKNFG